MKTRGGAAESWRPRVIFGGGAAGARRVDLLGRVPDGDAGAAAAEPGGGGAAQAAGGPHRGREAQEPGAGAVVRGAAGGGNPPVRDAVAVGGAGDHRVDRTGEGVAGSAAA